MNCYSSPILGQRWDIPLSYEAVRCVAREGSVFLEQFSLSAEALFGWELSLLEILKNAVAYAVSPQFIRLDIIVSDCFIQASVTDHTCGFDLDSFAQAPPPVDSDHGRGLLFVRSFMDSVSYVVNVKGNVFTFGTNRVNMQHVVGGVVKLPIFPDVPVGYCAPVWLRSYMPLLNGCWYCIRHVDSLGVLQLAYASHPCFPVKADFGVEFDSISSKVSSFFVSFGFNSEDPLFHAPACNSVCLFPLCLDHSVVGVFSVGRNDCGPLTPVQLALLRILTDLLAVDAWYTHARQSVSSASLVSRELDAAALVQKSVLNSGLPVITGYSISTHFKPALRVGGDIFFSAVAPGGFIFLVADVMGKDLSAALFSTSLMALVRSRLDLAYSPRLLLQWLSSQLLDPLLRAAMSITLQIVFLDVNTKTLRFVGAGHPPLFVADAGVVTEFGSSVPPLGYGFDCEIIEHVISITDSTCWALYSDGCTDLRNEAGVYYGYERFSSVLAKASATKLPASLILSKLLTDIDDFRAVVPISDDQAVIIVSPFEL